MCDMSVSVDLGEGRATVERYMNAFQYKNAIALATILYNQTPTDAHLCLLAHCHMRREEYAIAYDLLSSNTHTHTHTHTHATPTHTHKPYMRALCALKLNKLKEAEAILTTPHTHTHARTHTHTLATVPVTELSGVVSGGVLGVYLLGVICRRANRHSRAVELFRECVRVDPFMIDAATTLAEMGAEVHTDTDVGLHSGGRSEHSGEHAVSGSMRAPAGAPPSALPVVHATHRPLAPPSSASSAPSTGPRPTPDSSDVFPYPHPPPQRARNHSNTVESTPVQAYHSESSGGGSESYIQWVNGSSTGGGSLASTGGAGQDTSMSFDSFRATPAAHSGASMYAPQQTHPDSFAALSGAPHSAIPSSAQSQQHNVSATRPPRSAQLAFATPSNSSFSTSGPMPISVEDLNTSHEGGSAVAGSEKQGAVSSTVGAVGGVGSGPNGIGRGGAGGLMQDHNVTDRRMRGAPQKALMFGTPDITPIGDTSQHGDLHTHVDTNRSMQAHPHALSFASTNDSMDDVTGDAGTGRQLFDDEQSARKANRNPADPAAPGDDERPSLLQVFKYDEADPDAMNRVRAVAQLLCAAYGKLCMHDGEKALDLLHALPPRHFNTALVQQWIGKAHFEMANYPKAVEAYNSMMRLAPYRLSGLEYLSTALWQLNMKVELTYLAQRVTNIDKHSPEVWCAVGNCFSLQKEHESALRFFERATQVDPEFTYAYTLCGHEYVANEDFEKAITMFRKALQTDPRHYNAWYGLGSIYLRQEKYPLAEYHYQRALEINPQNPVLYCQLGNVLHRNGKFEQALQMLDVAGRKVPRNPQVWYARAEVLESLASLAVDVQTQRHFYEEALSELEAVRCVVPKEAQVHTKMGAICKKLDLRDEALRHYTIAYDLDPKDNYQNKNALERLEQADQEDDNFP